MPKQSWVSFAFFMSLVAQGAEKTETRCLSHLVARGGAPPSARFLIDELGLSQALTILVRNGSPATLARQFETITSELTPSEKGSDTVRKVRERLSILQTQALARAEGQSLRAQGRLVFFTAEGVLLAYDAARSRLDALTSPAETVRGFHQVAGYPIVLGREGPYLVESHTGLAIALPSYGAESLLPLESISALAANPRELFLAHADQVLGLSYLNQESQTRFRAPKTIRALDAFGTDTLFLLLEDGTVYRGTLSTGELSRAIATQRVQDIAVVSSTLLIATERNGEETSLLAFDADSLAPLSVPLPGPFPKFEGLDASGDSLFVKTRGTIESHPLEGDRFRKSTRDEDDGVALAARFLVRSGYRMNVGFLSRIFWAYHTQQHTDGRNKFLHYLMNVQMLGFLGAGLAAEDPWLATGAASSYLTGWAGHLLFEPNDPATWKYPLGSFASEFVLWWHILKGTRREQEIRYDAVSPMRRTRP